MADGNGDSFVRITNREIFDGLNDVKDQVKSMRNDLSNILEENVDLRKRVRGLEWKFYAVLSGLLGAIGAFLALFNAATRGGP